MNKIENMTKVELIRKVKMLEDRCSDLQSDLKEALEVNTKDTKSCENCKQWVGSSPYYGVCHANKETLWTIDEFCSKHEPK